MFNDDTVRLSILKQIKALYVAATDDIAEPAGTKYYGIKFSQVGLGPLSETDNRKRFAVGIVPGTERKSDLYPQRTAMMPVTVEFRVTVNRNDEEALVMAERTLGVVQQIFMDDETLAGTVLKSDETGNEQDLFTYNDKAISGMVQFLVHYRHSHNNVYTTWPV